MIVMAPEQEIQWIAAVTAAACALPGVFLVLRRMSLMSDAISHAILLGIVLALAAWFLPHRHAWARWMGLAASGLLALFSLLSAVSIGGVTVSLLLVLVLSVTAVTSLVARTTAAWVPRLRSPA